MHILSLSVSSSECGVLFCKAIVYFAVLNIILRLWHTDHLELNN